MTTSTVTPEIVAFAQGVRAALADLPAEEVDDLTEGLEADLAEAYAEDLQRELPDPAAYATELRAAAGLPMRTTVKTGVLAGLASSWHETRADLAVASRRNPALASAVDFLVELRPAWWIVRAWLAAWLVAWFFGNERGYGMAGTWWLVFAAFAVISVQWGRGRWQGRGVPALIAIGNVIAVIAFLPVLAATDDPRSSAGDFDRGFQSGVDATVNDPAPDGLTFRGHPVANIFAYDASGKPLRDVQLFTPDGKPLEPYASQSDDVPCAANECSTVWQSRQLETGQPVFNVFPLGTVAAEWDDQAQQTVPKPGATTVVPKAPFLKVPGVLTPKKVANSNE